MTESRWHWTAMLLVVSGVAVACVSTLAAAESFGPAQFGVFAGGGLALWGLYWFRRRLSGREQQLEVQQSQVERGHDELSRQQKEFEKIRQQAEAEFKKQASAIDRRQQALTRKLANWHEWLEYPDPVDLADHQEVPPPDNEEEFEQMRQLAERDRELNALLEEESKLLFENILTNKYVVEGAFQPTLLRDDAYELIAKVARIYRPEARQPLMETSIEQLVRAASRVCLHMLVVLEQLPVKVQHYNINSTYGWIRQGVKAYGVYRSARPYLPYVNSAYYLSRFALGANPFSLMAWWVASEVASRSASAVTRHLVNQKALALLSDVVRVIGYEVASIYGGDVRHRDPNWIYAVELTELMSRFPLSRGSLVHAMKEVGAVQLLNEYDRIFLYRCLAMHKTAQPQRYPANACLTSRERRAVATRLEKFYRGFVPRENDKAVVRWRAAVEERLGLKLEIAGDEAALSQQQQAEEAVRGLASFLAAVKQREGAELPQLLADCKTLGRIPTPQRDQLLQNLAENPPFFIEQPNIDPAADIARDYLWDLTRLAVRTSPRDMPTEPLIEEAATYLRVPARRIAVLMNQHYLDLFSQSLAADAQVPRVAPEVARAFVWLADEDERVQFVYGDVRLQWPEGTRPYDGDLKALWLLGTGQRLMLLQVGDIPSLLWIGDGSVGAQRQAGRWTANCLLSGGTWLAGPPRQSSPTIHLQGRIHERYKSYFAGVIDYCSTIEESPAASDAK